VAFKMNIFEKAMPCFRFSKLDECMGLDSNINLMFIAW
jgi:hypothetical protein